MNSKRAKLIKKRTADLLTSLGVPLGEGHGDYEQVNNCVSWEPAIAKDGTRIVDHDGVQLLKPMKNPGTIVHKWKYKVLYKWLKKMYKQGDLTGKEIANASAEQLLKMYGGKNVKSV